MTETETHRAIASADGPAATQRFECEVLPLLDQLFGGALCMTGNAADAEDLLEQTMMTAFANFESFTGQTSLVAWIYRIMDDVGAVKSSAMAVISSMPATYCELTDRQLAAIESLPNTVVKDAMRALPEDCRMTVFYADVEGLGYETIAEITRVPIETVMSRLQRGRRRLRELLELASRHHVLDGVPVLREP